MLLCFSQITPRFCTLVLFIKYSNTKLFLLLFFVFFHVDQNHYYTSRITQMYRGKVAGKMKKDGTEIKDII